MSKKCSDNNCLRFTIVSLTAKKLLKRQISEQKAIIPVKKTLWPIFSRSIEHDKCQRTIRWDQRVFWHFWASLEFFSIGPNRLLQNHFVKKNAIIPVIKINFSCCIESDKHQATTFGGPQVVLTIILQATWSFLRELRCCWKHKILSRKRQALQWRKDIGLF